MTKQLNAVKESIKVDKYLQNYAEPEWVLARWWAEQQLAGTVLDRVLLIPAYAERANLPLLLASAAEAAAAHSLRVLVLVVLNQLNDAPAWVQDDNAACSQDWQGCLNGLKSTRDPVPAFCGSWRGLELLFVERLEAGFAFPAKQGVGLARKIGGDIAYALYLQKQLRSHFAATSDGDALLPRDYFAPDRWQNYLKAAAVLYPFVHRAPCGLRENEHKAMRLYDAYLRYYRDGLEQAGSPYAFIPVGSTIRFNLISYGQVRGFPRTQAGEDFYFLNKLRKVGEVIEEQGGEALSLQGRVSARVPFGTGQSIAAISKLLDEGKPYLVYHASVFRVLKVFLEGVNGFCEQGSWQSLQAEWVRHLHAKKLFSVKDLERVLESLGGLSYLQSLPAKAKSAAQRRQHFNCWFDAFKTLKFIHALRDEYFSSVEFIL